MKFLFLDVDGCMNEHEGSEDDVKCNTFHRDKVNRLNRILRMTGAKIVLSSAWRYIILRGEANLAGMDWLLRSHGILCDRLFGHTREDTLQDRTKAWDGTGPYVLCNERGQQITDWLRAYEANGGVIDSYVVIDDGGHEHDTKVWSDLGIRAAGHPFVCCEGKVGLTDAEADLAIEILNANDLTSAFADRPEEC